MTRTFTEEEYSSNDGMVTYIWGPLLWHFLHILSFNYPVDPVEYNKKNNYKKGVIQNCYFMFIKLLQFTLPCKSCRDNLKKNLASLNFFNDKNKIMKNRESFSRFMYELHETINVMLNKPSNLKYEDVRDFYEHFRARCPKKPVGHVGCTKMEHSKGNLKKSKVIVYFVPYSEKKKIPTTKVHKKCGINCAKYYTEKKN